MVVIGADESGMDDMSVETVFAEISSAAVVAGQAGSADTSVVDDKISSRIVNEVDSASCVCERKVEFGGGGSSGGGESLAGEDSFDPDTITAYIKRGSEILRVT